MQGIQCRVTRFRAVTGCEAVFDLTVGGRVRFPRHRERVRANELNVGMPCEDLREVQDTGERTSQANDGNTLHHCLNPTERP